MYDVVVVGAGSAGATVAARLSEDPARSVLLLEAGPDCRAADAPEVVGDPDPSLIAALPDEHKAFHWHGLTNRVTEDGSPDTHYTRGRGPGGSSTINWMFAVRPPLRQFDAWSANGCRGWSADDVLPSFKRLERDLDFGHLPHHGNEGPLPIGRVPHDQWGELDHSLEAAALALGHAWIDDHNAVEPLGIGAYPCNVANGRRVSTNDAYIEPARERPNLTVRCDALVDRVQFDATGRAVGVWHLDGEGWRLTEAGRVVLSAGAIHSPMILLRSGIGPADDLAALGIEVRADVPTGRSLQDHPVAMLALEGVTPRGSPSRRPTSAVLRYSTGRDGAPEGDMFLLFMTRSEGSPYPNAFIATLQACRSRGELKLLSADPAAAPVIEERLLSHPDDRARLVGAVDTQLEILRQPAFRSLAHDVRLGPRGADARRANRDEIERWLLTSAGNGSHISCTCRMGAAGDPAAVVAPDGAAHGVSGLFVADASITPEVPWSNTNVPAIMIAEHLSHRWRATWSG